MRYLKVLLLAVFFFLAMIFLFQNQGPLSQQTELSMNLFFLPTMKSIPLPFYFIVVASFFVGCLMTLFMLLWDKFTIGAKLMKARWQVGNLQRQVSAMQKQLDKVKALPPATAQSNIDLTKAEAPKADAPKAEGKK